nr:hypothetical protein CFP56_64027 [Quercus suber]
MVPCRTSDSQWWRCDCSAVSSYIYSQRYPPLEVKAYFVPSVESPVLAVPCLGLCITTVLDHPMPESAGCPQAMFSSFLLSECNLQPPQVSHTDDKQVLYVCSTYRELPSTILVVLEFPNNSPLTDTNNHNATMPLQQIDHHPEWVTSDDLIFVTSVGIE